jgi:hypothetical protein
MSSGNDWRRISDLLHDARLQHLEWDQALGRVTLVFDPLRRAPDGSDLADSTVTFCLSGVSAIVAGYERVVAGIRPSEYRLDRLLEVDDLRDWPFAPQEVFVSVNSPACQDDVLNAPLTRWLFGGQDDLDDCDIRLGVTFEYCALFGLPTNHVRLLFGCADFEILSESIPLDLETWTSQYAAWWEHWRRYWDQTRAEEARATGRREETFIPVRPSAPPDRSYCPPPEPTVVWQPTDLPAELLQVLTDWIESTHQQDWLRLARVYPNLDVDSTERARQLARWAEQDFGRWWYARQIDGWWVEGSNAEVVVRGVEHSSPDEGEPARNTETVWTVRLRRCPDGWVIRTWAQGWPVYGSAPSLHLSEKPWVRRWRSGAILAERKPS